MMRNFKPALRDGSDPAYAPCTGASAGILYWKCPKTYRVMGYKPTSVALGRIGEADSLTMAAEARRLTVAMLDHFARPEYAEGTWDWLIDRYETDAYSPLRKVKGNTQETYRHTLKQWRGLIGSLPIGALTYERIAQIELDMKSEGKSASNIKRMITLLRIVTGYGKALRIPAARDVADTLSEMRFESAPRRTVHPTRDQIRAIIDEADARGMFSFATGLLIQWTFMLRSVDVRGQWLKDSGARGGIVRNGQRWQDGITWDMFAGDLSCFHKVISKTARSQPEAMRFEITPELRARLRLLGNGDRIGPVIVSERLSEPYTRFSWAKAFRRICDDLGFPRDLWMMDTRSGAITEARDMGADPFSIRDAAQHAHLSTTDAYMRGRSESAAKVVRLRNA